ncbi:polysaccharide biosynthesis C-terminal domain-containing protein [Acinetobacter haemolyticus]|uniref:Polysaccharide biosynthesis C-terminal domain-containing protein n=1 Tax=Acinetobacter haemolyticus TaxID=29430 RepID=A0AAW4J6T6_ACIHA|nr:polysaccharide biosynthesis C-terminal domain-containing protein [Acinetobacter haemolyticus]MBO3658606.1 polysaccharide biosynthesis C-terminal domain-containing protein [Acinetobacter haemolyticus]NAR50008.1 oligosaccharide flippase family protein [Acinetobacter haemolyticus]
MKNPFILIGVSEFFAKGISWLSLAVIPLFALPETYGQIVLYYSILVFFVPLFLFGQDRLILKNNPEQEVVNSIVFSLIIWLLLSVFLYVFGYFLASIAGLVLALNKVYLTYFRANDNYKAYALNRILYSIFRFIFVVSVVYYIYSLDVYIFSEILSALLVTVGLFIFFIKRKSSLSFNFKERFFHGTPLVLHGVSLLGVALVDRFILEIFTNFEVVGNYSFIYIFASGLIFLYSIVSIIQEKKIYKSDNIKQLIINSKKTLVLMLAIGFFGAIVSALMYFLLIKSSLVEGYGFYFNELLILIFAHMILPFYLVSNYILIQRNKAKYLLWCSLFAFFINALLNFMFIPVWGLKGAVWATLAANICLVLLSLFLSISVLKERRLA